MRRSTLFSIFVLLLACVLFWQRSGRLPWQAFSTSTPAKNGAPKPPSAAPASSPSGTPAAKTTSAAGSAKASRAAGEKLLHGAWGSKPEQFGRRHEPESNPEAPMALSAGANGDVLILDQVNRRIERYRGGKLMSSIAIGRDTVQDLAVGTQGRTVVLDRLADRGVQVYGADGQLKNEVPFDEKAIPQPGALTGVFADADGIYVERGHTSLVRIADADGNRDRPPEDLPGRPTRDGQLLISAALVDAAAGLVSVSAIQRVSRQPAWSVTVSLAAPVLHLLLLESDRAGRVYLAATTGHESPTPPYQLLDETIVAIRLGSGGVERGRLLLPPLTGADESFRPLSVDDSGDILMMSAQDDGLTVMRYAFP